MANSVTLSPQEYDIVWADLRLDEQPYPVAVRGHGRTIQERAAIRTRVYGDLTARRLANGPRVVPELEELLGQLGRAQVWIDLIWLPDQSSTITCNALAARTADAGLIAELLPDDRLRLTRVRGTAVVHALLDLLPRSAAGPGRSISLPVEALTPASTGRHAAEASDSIYDDAPSARVAAVQQVRALEALFANPRVRGGQLGVNCRDRHGRRVRGRPLDWFDTVNGRYAAQLDEGADGRDHLVVTPAGNVAIATRLHEMIDSLMGAVFA